MTLPDDFLKYPYRRRGMDHDFYEWSSIFERTPIRWPNNELVALWITPSLEFFPMVPNQGPFRAPGHMVIPHPDLRTFSSREYGSRVGAYRIFRVLDELRLKASVPMNSTLATRYPALVDAINRRDWEIIAHV